MSAIDALSLAIRPPVTVFDWSVIRVDVAVAKELGLKVGDVVTGVVESDADSTRFSLKFIGKPVSVPLQGNHFPSGPATFTVTAAGPNGVMLKPLTVAAAPVARGAQFISESMTAMSLALRPQALAAISRFMAPQNLEALIRNTELAGCLMPFFTRRLNTRGLTPVALKEAIQSCGLWTEAKLAAGHTIGQNDGKLTLLRLLDKGGAGSFDAAALDTIKQALGEIESSQMQAVQAQSHGELLLSMAIPFENANPLHLSFSRAAVSDEQPSPPFVIDAYSDDDVLGKLWLKTFIEKSGGIDIVMWAISDRVVATAAAAAGELGKHLAEFGLTLKKISIIHGARPDTAPPPQDPGQMVNVQI